MRLRDMLAAAVRPWVQVRGTDRSATIEFGKFDFWGPRWRVEINSGSEPLVMDGKVVGSVRHGKPLVGDLYMAVYSRRRMEREREEWKKKCAAEKAANDSKAAA